ncbi:MAG: DUF427 domain-containing protein [Arenibacterium sp.]
MNAPVQSSETGYRISVSPLVGRVQARRNGVLLADSSNARVMYETRLSPAVYFPKEDVKVDLLTEAELMTFCPFKGTATYYDLELDGERIENAAWSYERALPESQDIEGHVGFMAHAGLDIDIGINSFLDGGRDGNISGPLPDWLLRYAATYETADTFTQAFAGKLLEQGIQVSRISVMIWSLHPLIVGKNYVWNRKNGKVATYAPSYEIHDHPAFVNSPLRHVANGLGGIRQRLGDVAPEHGFPVLDDLKGEGATDYVAMPMTFSDGRVHVLTMTSDHPEGFSTSDLGLVFECSSAISRFYEVFMQKENAQSLLETYVGKRSGARVLGGDIRRGDGDEIDAAIMFCDLRDSSHLAETLGQDEYLSLLNRFFETATESVQAHGGEVLKFIGDAVLAVFPVGSDMRPACAQAMAAARDIQMRSLSEEFRCAIGMDFGRVTFGNVGSRERLDFTVIGQAANVAARLCDLGKTRDLDIVASGAVAGAEDGAAALGPVQLRNVSQPIECFSITWESEQSV